MNDADY